MPSMLGIVASNYSVGEIPIPPPPPPPPPEAGAVSGAITWVGSVNGARLSKGAVSGAISWVGVVNGLRPVAGAKTGEVIGAVSWVGTINGLRMSKGDVSGAVTWVGTVDGAMPAAPEFASVASIGVTISSTTDPPLGANHAMNMPSGITAGDLLVSFISIDNGSTTAVTCSATYSQRYIAALSGNLAKHSLCARVATGTSDDNLSWSGNVNSNFACTVMRIVDHGLASGASLLYAKTETTTNGVPDPPSLDAGVSAKNLWIVFGAIDIGVPNVVDGLPANYDLVSALNSNDADFNSAHLIGSRELETQVENPGAYTNSPTTDWMACTIVIPPPA